jgi:mono/diheme cytochrome c family protein
VSGRTLAESVTGRSLIRSTTSNAAPLGAVVASGNREMSMSNRTATPRARGARFSWAAVPLLLGALGGCGTDTGGYAPVTHRERQSLPGPAMPDPPRVVAGVGAAGPAAVPVLAAANMPPGVTQEMVEEGQRLYGTVCVACHGPAGSGTAAAPALNDTQWVGISDTYDAILNVIHTGVAQPRQYPGQMPARGGGNFTDEQTRAIAAYVYALSRAGAS